MQKLVSTLIAVVLFTATLVSAEAFAQRRIATIIGNSNYQSIPRLRNPERDSALLATRLRGLGFDVQVHNNLDRTSLRMRIRDHGERLKAAGRDAVGFFFYGGHAMEVDGSNFLLPTDFPAAGNRAVVQEYAVNADLIRYALEEADNQTDFVVLDACRDNPLGDSRNTSGGLARMDAPGGTLIAYSTAPGRVALDGQGENSPYVLGLYRALGEQGLTAEQVFRRTRERVLAETRGQQMPWESSSLTGGDFYFKQGPVDRLAVERERRAAESLFWETVKDSRSPDDFEAYLRIYPNGAFAALAQSRKQAALAVLERLRRERIGTGTAPSQPTEPAPLWGALAPPTDFWAPSSTRIASAPRPESRAQLPPNLGLVLQVDSRPGAPPFVIVAEVKSASPFSGKVAVGDLILTVNHAPIATDGSLAFVLSDALQRRGRVDLSVMRGQARYTYAYRPIE